MMEASIVRECKEMIERSSLQSLQEYYQDLLTSYCDGPYMVDWAFVLQKVYLHACLKKKRDMAAWLEERFKDLDPIAFMAYRHTINYGRVLLKK
jgi:hypothetical protein